MTGRFLPVALGTFLLLGVPACQHQQQTGKRYFVAFSQCNNAEPYRAAQNQLMEKLFQQRGDVQLVIADGQQDNSKQIAQIETFIRQKPDLLIVAPNERAPLTEVMGRAMMAGIPVICLERDITQPNYTTFIGADNLSIGKMAGQFIVDDLRHQYGKAEGKVVEIRGLLGVEAEMERYNGAHEVLKAYPGIRVIHEAVADWIQSNARERMLEILVALARKTIPTRTDPARMRAADLPRLLANASLLHSHTGWTPELPLETTLADMLQFWRDEP